MPGVRGTPLLSGGFVSGATGQRPPAPFPAMKPGTLVRQMPYEQYRSAAGLNISALAEMKRSPRHAWHAWRHRAEDEEEDTPALLVGRLVHSLVLTPEAVAHQFYVEQRGQTPSGPPPGENARRVTPAVWRDARVLAGAVSGDATAAATLATFPARYRETSIFWEEVFSNGDTLPCKARLDAVRPTQGETPGVILDLKTIRDASPRAFARAVRDYGWDLQAAWYLRAWNQVTSDAEGIESFVWLAIEKSPPHVVAVYAAPPALLLQARETCERYLTWFQQCRENNHWPGYTPLLEIAGEAQWLDPAG